MIYEGNTQVKKTKGNFLVYEYELFKMKPEESISEMFARLSEITNGLKALGKEYSSSELMRKVLGPLPPTWHTKVTVIEESKDLSTSSLEELIGSLMIYEINVQKNEDESKKKKSIALKTSKISQSSSDEIDSDKQDEVAMITRQVKKFLQKKKRSQENFKETKKNYT